MKILVVNAGSSSLKYQLFDMDEQKVLAKGLCEQIGPAGNITHKRPGQATYAESYPMPTHHEAIELVLKLLTDAEWGVIKSVDEIGAVGHRFAHGGKFKSSQVLTDAEMEYLESIVPINPLHGPPAIKGVNACRALMPNTPHVGVFDTSFYSTLEPKAYMYALPYEWYEKYGIRKYGFHGTSHRYVAAKAAEYLGKDIKDLKIITCHIGSGSSITAIDGGKAVDTSMGFTPHGRRHLHGLHSPGRSAHGYPLRCHRSFPGDLHHEADRYDLRRDGCRHDQEGRSSGRFGHLQ